MTAIKFAGSNAVFKLPGCTDLPAKTLSTRHGPAVTTMWLPSEEERAAIAAGAPIALTIVGAGQPPIVIYVPFLCPACEREIETQADGAAHPASAVWYHRACLDITLAGEGPAA